MSDNGQTGVGEPVEDMYRAGMRGLKGSEYDGGHRVPCFVRWPGAGIEGGRDIPELTGYVDFMPTILDLCGVEAPSGRSFHGDSLVPLLRGETGGRWRERILTTDTQRVAHPIKWRHSCVMKDTWRLVNRDELYNIADDPAQENDLAGRHPDLVAELRAAYEEWWELCARRMDEEIPTSLGAGVRDEAILRSHDLRNEQDHSVVWDQEQVRRGMVCHGWWEVAIEQDGLYEIELRRWPKEAGHAVTAGIDGDDVEFRRDAIAPGAEGMYSGGRALGYDTAVLNLSGRSQQCVEVNPNDLGATFTLRLEQGSAHLRAQFSDCRGAYSSAYYVYVRRIG